MNRHTQSVRTMRISIVWTYGNDSTRCSQSRNFCTSSQRLQSCIECVRSDLQTRFAMQISQAKHLAASLPYRTSDWSLLRLWTANRKYPMHQFSLLSFNKIRKASIYMSTNRKSKWRVILWGLNSICKFECTLNRIHWNKMSEFISRGK